MRELSSNELNEVSGGFIPIILGGAALSGAASYYNGDSAKVIFASALLGGLSGVAGTAAKVTTGIVRAKFSLQSGGLGLAANTVGSNGTTVADDETQEIEVEK